MIRQLERDRVAALVAGDAPRARLLHADDYELINPGGAVVSGDDYLAAIGSGDIVYHRFEAEPGSDVEVRFHGTAAVVRYRAVIDITFPGGVDSGRFWHTDLYELRGGRWQAVWSQATRIP